MTVCLEREIILKLSELTFIKTTRKINLSGFKVSLWLQYFLNLFLN
jgi:hypothetical protein